MKNKKPISKLNEAVEKARTDLYNIIKIYGWSSKEVIIASQRLDKLILNVYKEELNING